MDYAKSRLLKNILPMLIMLAGSTMGYTSLARAQACTYNEALLAFQQGNLVRGQALLGMAVKDGDSRAIALFDALKRVLRDGEKLSEDKVGPVIAEQWVPKQIQD